MVPSPQRPSALHQLPSTRSQVAPALLHHTYPRGPRRRRPVDAKPIHPQMLPVGSQPFKFGGQPLQVICSVFY